MNGLVLSIFPGIDLLGRAFEEEGYCVVRGPDVLWGGDIRAFHPPAGVFEGVIGGPPCQAFSSLARLVRANGHEPRYGNLIPEFERVVAESQPAWFLMENVTAAPIPRADGYGVHAIRLDNRWVGGEQMRRRQISFGTKEGRTLDIDVVALEQPVAYQAVTSGNGFGNGGAYYRRINTAVTSSDGGRGVKMVRYSVAEAARLQGWPMDILDDAPFTAEGKLRVIANGVPRWMGLAIARAVKRAMEASR